MNKHKISVRRQKVRKDHTRGKLLFFSILVLAILLIAAFAQKICPFDPYAQDLLQAQKPPGGEHLLGTDRFGRDLFSRILAGSTASIYATLLLVAIVTVTGTVLGLICGWYGGKADTVLMRISDLFLAFPSLVFALAVAGVLGGGMANAVIALAMIGHGRGRSPCQWRDLSLHQAAGEPAGHSEPGRTDCFPGQRSCGSIFYLILQDQFW